MKTPSGTAARSSVVAARVVLIRARQDFGNLRLAWSAAGLPDKPRMEGVLCGLPCVAVVVDAGGKPLRVPTLFLSHVALCSDSVMGDTARSYGEALVSWLRFLNRKRVPLARVNEETIGLYRAELRHGPSRHGPRPCALATARHRLAVAVQFHRWGQRTGGLPTPLGEFLIEFDQDQRAMKGATRQFPRGAFPVPTDERLPQLLGAGEVRKVLDLAPQPYRLMFRWAVTTGFRRFEVASLLLSDLPEGRSAGAEAEGLVQFDLMRKGGRLCSVYVPAQLLEETWWYVLTERTRGASSDEPSVFLTRRGVPVSRSTLSKVFRRCADAAGSTATLHHLRHTFATNVLRVLDAFERDVEPMNSIKTLQVLLGHATVRSTEIYLRALHADSAAVAEMLGYLYGDTVF